MHGSQEGNSIWYHFSYIHLPTSKNNWNTFYYTITTISLYIQIQINFNSKFFRFLLINVSLSIFSTNRKFFYNVENCSIVLFQKLLVLSKFSIKI